MTNPDAGTVTCVGCFTVDLGPTVTTISPTGASDSGPVPVTVTGTHFHIGAAQLQLVRPGFTTITATAVAVNGAGTTLTATFDLTGQAPVRWIVVVTNTDDHGVGTLGDGTTGGFLVSNGAPTVTAVLPTVGGQGATGLALTLTGTNFAQDAVVTVSGAGVTVTSATFSSRTSYLVTVTISAGAAKTARDVTLTNADTQAGTCGTCFTVAAGPTGHLVNTERAWSRCRQSGSCHRRHELRRRADGSPFAGTVAFSGTGITVNTETRDGSTQLTVNVTISVGAAATARRHRDEP